MRTLISRLFGRRTDSELPSVPRMARVTWIAFHQGRVRSAFES